MRRIILVLILASLAVSIACGGQRLSVDEYAEECGDVADELDDGFNIDVYYADDLVETFEAIEDALEVFKSLNPPEEVEYLHNLKVEAAELALKGLRDTDFLNLSKELSEILEEIEDEDLDYDDRRDKMEDFEDKWEDKIDEMEDKFDEYEDELNDLRREIREEEEYLDSDVYEDLSDEGCV